MVSKSWKLFRAVVNDPLALIGICPPSIPQFLGLYVLYTVFHAYRDVEKITLSHFRAVTRADRFLNKIAAEEHKSRLQFGSTEIIGIQTNN